MTEEEIQKAAEAHYRRFNPAGGSIMNLDSVHAFKKGANYILNHYRWRKIDPNNLPREHIIGMDVHKNIKAGIFDFNALVLKVPMFDINFEVEFYILQSELINLPRE